MTSAFDPDDLDVVDELLEGLDSEDAESLRPVLAELRGLAESEPVLPNRRLSSLLAAGAAAAAPAQPGAPGQPAAPAQPGALAQAQPGAPAQPGVPAQPAAPGAPPAAAAAPAVPPPPPPPATNPMKGKIYVLTDYACQNACLDFMDLVTRLPNVVQAGNTTGTDTIFVEPKTVILGNARLTYPLRAWLDRPRASNVAYTPAPNLTWTGAYNDETGFRAWLDKAVGGAAAPAAPAAH